MELTSWIQVCLLRWAARAVETPQFSSAAVIRKIPRDDDISTAMASKQQLPKGQSHTTPFYKEVLRTWFSTHNFQPQDEDEVRAEVIWNNKFISISKRPLPRHEWQHWADAGITRIHHICHPSEDRFLGHQELRDRYNIQCNFLLALTIQLSIPHRWLLIVPARFDRAVSQKLIFEIGSKKFYLPSSSRGDGTDSSSEVIHPFLQREVMAPGVELADSTKLGEGLVSPIQSIPRDKAAIIYVQDYLQDYAMQ